MSASIDVFTQYKPTDFWTSRGTVQDHEPYVILNIGQTDIDVAIYLSRASLTQLEAAVAQASVELEKETPGA